MKNIQNFLKITLSIIFPFWLIIYLWPNKKRRIMPFFQYDTGKPYNIAHRGGGQLAPEETLEAFSKALASGADLLEYDVHITADGHLIASHDPTVDRITDGHGVINEMTLEEIKSFDAGARFRDAEGNAVYAGRGVKLATIEEIFQTFPNTRAVVELKDDNYPELYEAMIQEMWRLIQEYDMEDLVVIGSFDDAIIQRFQDVSGGAVAIGAGVELTTPYITKLVLRLNGLAELKADSLQLPTEQKGLNLASQHIIRTNRKRGIEVYYWTINDEPTMRYLIRQGVDGIMTDNPELLQRVMIEEGVRNYTI